MLENSIKLDDSTDNKLNLKDKLCRDTLKAEIAGRKFQRELDKEKYKRIALSSDGFLFESLLEHNREQEEKDNKLLEQIEQIEQEEAKAEAERRAAEKKALEEAIKNMPPDTYY